MASRPTTPRQSPQAQSRAATPRLASPQPEPGQIYSPSTPQDFRRRYDSNLLSSPASPVTGLSASRTLQRNLSSTPNSPATEEQLELGQLPTLSRSPSVQPHSSPFHDSKAWKRSSEFEDKDSPNGSMRSGNNGAQYSPFPKSSTGSVEEYHEPALDFGLPKKKKELLDALGYDSPHVERHFTGGASLDFDKHPSNERAEDTKEEPSEWKPPRPSMRLLFSLCTTRDFFFHILPCIIFSLGGGTIPPIMTLLVGDAFGAFSSYPADVSQATSEQRSELMKSIGHSCLIFFIVGLAGWVVNTLMLTYWTRLGEVIANRLRAEVYRSVMARGMEWFDLGMGFKEDASGNLKVKEDGEEAGVGAGGLMAKFTRETDDVRIACGSNMGQAVQQSTVFLACCILAFIKSYKLTLVTLSAIPLVVGVQIVTQVLASPLFAEERRALEDSSTTVERSTNAISTVKAFNAQKVENERFQKGVARARRNYIGQAIVWSLNNGITSLLLQIMFVAGFWFGAKLVRSGKISAADVMTVFWACLLGSSSLQGVVPHLVFLAQGKASMASLITMIRAPSGRRKTTLDVPHTGNSYNPDYDDSHSPSPFSPLNIPPQMSIVSVVANLPVEELLTPSKAYGEFTLRNVTFAYPARPDTLALDDVSIFLPAGETTFIVGGSGSGKSTIAQLLLRLYQSDGGDIQLDDHPLKHLSLAFTREHISAVQQGCIMFDMSLHDNVSMGLAGLPNRKPEDATREEVVEACKMAMLDDFIQSLPEGYETKLGTKGSSLSGGQRQRLAIARARLRNPTILVLDEATSALDVSSRIVVFEAIKKWRRNRTTIVITHDLSQILPTDFVYLMKNGRLHEQGYRADLMVTENSEFGKMATMQAEQPLMEADRDPWADAGDEVEMIFDDMEDQAIHRATLRPTSTMFAPNHQSRGYLDYLSFLGDYEKNPVPAPADAAAGRMSALAKLENRRTSSTKYDHAPPQISLTPAGRQLSYRFERQSAIMRHRRFSRTGIPRNSMFVVTTDIDRTTARDSLETEDPVDPDEDFVVSVDNAPKIFRVLVDYFPGMPKKWLLVLGSICSVGHGVLTPMWSKYIAVLMAFVSYGGTDTAELTKTSLIVVAITVANSVALVGQYFFFDNMSAYWVSRLRQIVYEKVMSQPQAWFDKRSNSPGRLVQILIKDVEDMKAILATVIGRSITAGVMVVVGIAWAMAIGWKLTMVGFAVGPVFAVVIVISSRVNTIFEARNKEAREQVSRTFYESVANVRSIRAMALEETFLAKFQKELGEAQRTGFMAALGQGGGTGVTVAVPYFIQALMIYVSSIFMTKGYYDFATMMQVYTLVLFSVTFASQFLDFIPSVAKSRMAAASFSRLRDMSVDTTELKGDLRFPITGSIRFNKVAFNYPTRPNAKVLQDISFEVKKGECVCLVGPSGSGKSTISALLQRLYEPLSGRIQLDNYDLGQSDVTWLREHVAVVSQHANLFDASVAENIAYGSTTVSLEEIQRAAKAASVHDFIMSLPQGYDTNLGENASLISGGQAQRLQIARALVRQASILILDECTSALDPENQRAVLDTIMRVKQDRTTIFITHKADVMKRCDRVLCLSEGRIAEDGSYAQLMGRRGMFSKLMQAAVFE